MALGDQPVYLPDLYVQLYPHHGGRAVPEGRLGPDAARRQRHPRRGYARRQITTTKTTTKGTGIFAVVFAFAIQLEEVSDVLYPVLVLRHRWRRYRFA